MVTEYNFTHRLSITRNRQLEVFINRKSITFRVHYHASFLRGWQVLGRATLELKPLLKSCEALAVAEVRNRASRIAVGGESAITCKCTRLT